MTTLTPQQIAQQLADLIPQRDQAVKACEEIRSSYEAEFAVAFTTEKRLKEQVESLKQQLREQLAESGEKVEGVTLAHIQQVVWNKEDEAALVTWCTQYAPSLLTLKGLTEIRKWFFASPIQTVSVHGKPSAILIATQTSDDGQEYTLAVPCPFHLEPETQVRISENAIVTAVDREKWEADHE